MFHVNDRIRFRNPIPDLTLQVGVDEAARYGRLAAVIGDVEALAVVRYGGVAAGHLGVGGKVGSPFSAA